MWWILWCCLFLPAGMWCHELHQGNMWLLRWVNIVLPSAIRTCSDRLSDPHSLCFCLQTVRNGAEPSTLCLWLTAQSQWVWPTSHWRRTLSSTPSTDWDPLPKTPSQRQVYKHLFIHLYMLLTWFQILSEQCKKKKVTKIITNTCRLSSQAQGWELFNTVTVEPSRPFSSTTPRSIRCLLSRSHTHTTNTHTQTALKFIFRM